jgi:glycine/D-amino acid oxidase-like deaminating enzyme
MQADYIIVGQGLSGSLLAMELMAQGSSVLVVDDDTQGIASKVAGGIINPVTGKRLVTSWMAGVLLPFAADVYNKLSIKWNVPLLQPTALLEFHFTHEGRSLFDEKMNTGNEYLYAATNEERWQEYFRFNYGIGVISPGYVLDIRTLLAHCRKDLQQTNALLSEKFMMDECEITSASIIYRHVRAKKIIFCDGAKGSKNPYFQRLPWSEDKGEALIVSIPGLPRAHIFKQGISIIPWQDDLFWVGAAHDWKFTDMNPTPAFRQKVTEQLDYWLRLPYIIIDHLVAQRPANLERKPFVGLHPGEDAVGILNGMGGKGCSLAPYFAVQLAHHLVHGSPILPDADVRRFERILCR